MEESENSFTIDDYLRKPEKVADVEDHDQETQILEEREKRKQE
jgi:hypothetical protein